MPDLADRTARENDLSASLLAALVALRKSIDGGSPDWQTFRTDLQSALAESLASTFAAAAGQLAKMHGEGKADDFDATSGAAAYANTKAAQRAAEAVANTQAAVNDSAASTAARDYWFSQARANTFAITETTAAISAGEDFAAAALAVILLRVVAWFWETEEDDSVCSICRPLNGQRDPNAEQPAHPGCRCRKRYDFSKPIYGAAA